MTKERSEAIERNFKVASCIKVAINQVDMVNPVLFPKFKPLQEALVAMKEQLSEVSLKVKATIVALVEASFMRLVMKASKRPA